VRKTPPWLAALGQGHDGRQRPLPELVALGVLAVVIVVAALFVVVLVVVTFWPVATALAVVLGCALVARHLYRWKGRAPRLDPALGPYDNAAMAQAPQPVSAVDHDKPEVS